MTVSLCSLADRFISDLVGYPEDGINLFIFLFDRGLLGIQNRGLKLNKVCTNGDPGLTLTNFTARSNLVTWAIL